MKANKYLIIGASGYIGHNLYSYLRNRGFELYGTYLNSLHAQVWDKEDDKDNLYRLDITDYDGVLNTLNEINPDAIIHTAALSSLERCEKNIEKTMKINVEGTHNIINSISSLNSDIKFIFFSSDYVFDGMKGIYNEGAIPNPKTVYGKSKAISEGDIKSNLRNYIIVRTASVFGHDGGNFFNFVVSNLKSNKIIEVYNNTFFTPTYIDYLMDSLSILIAKNYKGTIHISGCEKISRYGFASMIANVLGKDASLIKSAVQPLTGLISNDSSLSSTVIGHYVKEPAPSLVRSLYFNFGYLIWPLFYFEDARGKLVGISREHEFHEINYIESIKGSCRGDHFHKETLEAFYIISGKIEVSLINIMTNERKEFIVGAGDFFIIEPNNLHTFYALEDSKWINMLSKLLESKNRDIYQLR